MRRKGTIAIIDPDQGAAAILTADSGYTIIELDPDWSVEIGDHGVVTVATWNVCMSPSSSLIDTYSPTTNGWAPKR